MKKIATCAFAVAIAVLTSSSHAAESKGSGPTEEAVSVVQQQLDASNSRNMDAFAVTYADDVKVYEYPDKLLIDGVVKLKERYAQIFSDGALHARIANRMAMGQRVIDHEFVTRTFPDGLGVKQWIAIYDVKDRKIVRVTLMPGPVDMGAKQ